MPHAFVVFTIALLVGCVTVTGLTLVIGWMKGHDMPTLVPNNSTGAPNAYTTKESTMNDAAKRAFRTFAQGFIGVLALIAIPALNNIVQAVAGGGEVEVDVNFWQGILIAAVAGGVIALISFGQNALEAKSHTNVLPK